MSKQDTHYINIFSLVIGLLVLIAICIFAFARIVASHPNQQVMQEADSWPRARRRPGRFRTGQLRAGDQERNHLGLRLGEPGRGTQARGLPAVCSLCHGAGIAGAPKAGDDAAWAPRIAQGKARSTSPSATRKGVMPAKGARTDLSDDLIKQGVDYMVQMAQ